MPTRCAPSAFPSTARRSSCAREKCVIAGTAGAKRRMPWPQWYAPRKRSAMYTPEQLEDWRQRALRVEEEVAKAIVGQRETIRLINVALFARGHVLLEGDVGVGKTTLLR